MSLTIGVIGQVSSGKSSLINALLCKLVSKVALERATLRPISYHCDHGTSTISAAEEAKLLAAVRNNKLTEAQRTLLRTPVNVCIATPGNCVVIDFAGIDDGTDNSGADVFLDAFEHNLHKLDVVLFVSKCDNVFVLGNELRLFQKIAELVDRNISRGRYQKLVVVANKYDFEDDEIDAVVRAAAKSVKETVYKVSAWKLFMLRSPAVAATAEWERRELKKMSRVAHQTLSADEKALLALTCEQVVFVDNRIACLAVFIEKSFADQNAIDENICAIATLSSDLAPHMAGDARIIRAVSSISVLPVETNVLYAFAVMRHLGYSLIECLRLVPQNSFSCIYYAWHGNYTAFGPYIGPSWKFDKSFTIHDNLLASLKPTKHIQGRTLTAQHLARELFASAGKPLNSSVTISDNEVIGLIKETRVREFIALKDVTYEQVVANIFVSPSYYSDLIVSYVNVTNSKLTEQVFKRAIADAYYLQNKRGKLERLIGEIM